METTKTKKFTQSYTFKGFIIAVLVLILLIPQSMISDLIYERKYRSIETIEIINEKWSNPQTICGPILSIPYLLTKTETELIETKDNKKEKREKIVYEHKILHITPEQLNINAQLYPEEKHYGIYKTILYKSDIDISGNFKKLSNEDTTKYNFQWEKAYLTFGLSDLKGDWKTPSFIGKFSPDSNIDDKFEARWTILHFNRNIPESWVGDYSYESFNDSQFGVSLINAVDHYQQNERSSKYAIMFIALTFVVFFFVEVLTKRKIHPLQYLLVGIALILFYSLLLSISEQINFAIAYLIASIATIGLITAYAHSIFKNKTHTAMLAALLCGLYIFLYVILQLEDIALLIGSVGLFIILGIIMFVSRKINFYKQDDPTIDNEHFNDLTN